MITADTASVLEVTVQPPVSRDEQGLASQSAVCPSLIVLANYRAVSTVHLTLSKEAILWERLAKITSPCRQVRIRISL